MQGVRVWDISQQAKKHEVRPTRHCLPVVTSERAGGGSPVPLQDDTQGGPGHGDGGGGDFHAQKPRSGPRTRRSGMKVPDPT